MQILGVLAEHPRRGLAKWLGHFLRPMFGMPLMLYVLLRTDYKNESDVINENNLITQIFVQFFYNLICDKAYSLYTKRDMCVPFVKECKKATVGLRQEDHERVLSILNAQCNGFSTAANGNRLLLPFKNFMIKMGRNTNMKKVNKIASTVLIGFYLRHYLEFAQQSVSGSGVGTPQRLSFHHEQVFGRKH